MMEYGQEKVFNSFHKILNSLMLILFLPVMFCVMFIGNNMDYFDDVKADILVPNALLTVIALTAFGICLWLIHFGQRFQYTKRMGLYLDIALVVLFTGFYFFCIALSEDTIFNMSVDQGIVREAAKDVAHGIDMGYRFEFSIDYNNIPITYILGQLYKLAEGWTWFHHNPEYLWLMTGCFMVTAAGFCCCEIVKKLTRNPAAVLVAFALYFVTAGLSPWKSIPYTDSYGILFPVLCFWLYLSSRDCKNIVGKIFLLLFSFIAGTIGGFIKPSAYIAVLSVLGIECICFLTALVRWIKNRKKASAKDSEPKQCIHAALLFLLSLLFAFTFSKGTKLFNNYIIDDIGLEYNEELESTLQYYLFIGANELTTGSFAMDDYTVFGEFQFSKADRNAACLERAWERIKGRGFGGTIYFCLKKLVKSFNDGTFAWTDVQYYQPFPEPWPRENRIAGYLRSLFIPEQPNQCIYDTLAELAWIFTLIGIPGMVLTKKKKEHHLLFPIMLIGILLYLMLFESGARYIYIFLPLFVIMSIRGADLIQSVLWKWRQKDAS